MDPAKTNWKVIGLVVGVFVAVGIVATYFLVGGRLIPDPVGKLRREGARRGIRRDPNRVDPGFRLSRGVFPADRSPMVDQVYWRITNERNDPLVVKGVTYNGEYEARLRGDLILDPRDDGRVGGTFRMSPTPGLPVRLTVGESCEVLQCWCWQQKGYVKEIIYIDVHTNRGSFRYRPGRGFE